MQGDMVMEELLTMFLLCPAGCWADTVAAVPYNLMSTRAFPRARVTSSVQSLQWSGTTKQSVSDRARACECPLPNVLCKPSQPRPPRPPPPRLRVVTSDAADGIEDYLPPPQRFVVGLPPLAELHELDSKRRRGRKRHYSNSTLSRRL